MRPFPNQKTHCQQPMKRQAKMSKKDIEIQPGFKPGSSEFRSDDMLLPTEPLELWHCLFFRHLSGQDVMQNHPLCTTCTFQQYQGCMHVLLFFYLLSISLPSHSPVITRFTRMRARPHTHSVKRMPAFCKTAEIHLWFDKP